MQYKLLCSKSFLWEDENLKKQIQLTDSCILRNVSNIFNYMEETQLPNTGLRYL